MRIGVISDTHTGSIDGIPRKVIEVLRKMDLIIHAGDFTEGPVLDELRNLGSFRGVYGNLDSFDVKRTTRHRNHRSWRVQDRRE